MQIMNDIKHHYIVDSVEGTG